MDQLLSVVEELAETVRLEPPHDSRRCEVCQEGAVTVQRQLSLRLLLNVQHRWSCSVQPLLPNWRYACRRSRAMAAAAARRGRLRIGGAPSSWPGESLLLSRLHHASQCWRGEVHGGPELGARARKRWRAVGAARALLPAAMGDIEGRIARTLVFRVTCSA